jgi:NAD(P)-dependent dehydrogenase (short-subunit alcohol dehydrogenase family)
VDVALVTGAHGTLGSAVIETLSARGDTVVAVDRSRLDVADPDAVEAFWDELARAGELPRWVVNTVGGFRPGALAESEAEDVHAMLETNLETAFWTCRAAARRLDEGGGIVNVAARAALLRGGGSTAYAVAKAGVVRLTEVLADELAPKKIRVNAVVPSTIGETGVPPEQIASVIAFLCSDAAAAVSGAAIPVYGWA